MSGHGHAYDVNDERPLIFARSRFSHGVCRCLCRANAVNELSLYSAIYSILLNCLVPVAPPGGSFPLWVDVQKLCNMCVLSLLWNFFVSHDKYIARPSSKEPR